MSQMVTSVQLLLFLLYSYVCALTTSTPEHWRHLKYHVTACLPCWDTVSAALLHMPSTSIPLVLSNVSKTAF